MIKVGVIGAGHLGKIHLSILNNSDFELVGFHDTDVSNSEKLSQEQGYQFFKDFDSLINKIDAAVIVSPTTTHFEIAKKCISKGKHIFVEKPLTTNSKEARIIKRLAMNEKIRKKARVLCLRIRIIFKSSRAVFLHRESCRSKRVCPNSFLLL